MRRAFAFLTLIAIAACGDASKPTLNAPDAFIREPAPSANMTAAYLSVSRPEKDRLVAASVEGVARTELHTVIKEDGVSKMRMVEGFDMEPNEPLVLAPGGNHLMLIGLEEPLAGDDERDVTLNFESGAEVKVRLPVRGR